ncbi:DUF6302 family protein [Streptomyces sp. NPDC048290]|uniref:DUF6302 family protein n=1 Tax=Streptomyces sp. NPDC048290 TaxID=3155811 RepID=UPI0034342527
MNPPYAGIGPGVRLLPPGEALDFGFWAARLANPALLEQAVAVAGYRIALLAVPAGPGRRGGRADMLDASFAALTARELEGRPGFSRVASSGPCVTWGEPLPPDLSKAQRARFYGLRESPADPWCRCGMGDRFGRDGEPAPERASAPPLTADGVAVIVRGPVQASAAPSRVGPEQLDLCGLAQP